ncbi:NAD(P)H-quinone oxidoreductase [Noviherbaspirillum sedimenti]|uniref:NAD(P)H-quinone oxidoreductase n=1 Tax=Noviherbaspirillum sedimenti TaxID=2320865 RepID=A0A3A3GAL1_9BURK|nr:NAD(P)H-quinone oxidoreductase [Noviherbaspirillum sedimenti]RJG03652.1 NAD(P)H-quinone oxidoreductase [Noviherbaspirillum sedimenti]
MKRITHGAGGGIDVLRISEDDRPSPGAGEVLIEVHYAGVNRPDIQQRSGSYPPPPGASPYLGLEVSGTIAALGPGVSNRKVGDQVCALTPGGGYAEFCLVDGRHCLPIPAGLTLLQAAALPENYFTVWANVFDRAQLQDGMSILVHGGSSGIGLTAIQLAHAFGAKVFTTAGSAKKLEACLAAGASAAFNYREEDFVEAILRETDGRGVDIVLDMVGTPYVERNIQCLAVEGCLLQISFLMGSHFSFDATPLMRKRLTLTGSTLRGRTDQQKAEIARNLKANVWPLLAAGKCLPVIDSVFSFEQAGEAHALMESSQHIGKIMLAVKGDRDAAQ